MLLIVVNRLFSLQGTITSHEVSNRAKKMAIATLDLVFGRKDSNKPIVKYELYHMTFA